MKEYITDNIRVFVVPTEILQADLSIYEKMVYVVLRSYCNAHRDEAFPSYSTIAKLSSMSKRQAIRVVDSLIEKGYIVKETRYKGDRHKIIQTSNRYILTIPRGSDYQSPGVVTDSHQGSDYQSPGVVTDSHQGSDYQSPEKIYIKDIYIDDDDDELPKKILEFIHQKNILDKLETIKKLYKQYRNRISEEIFIKKIELTLIHGVNFESYLTASLENEMRKKSEMKVQEKTMKKDTLPDWIIDPDMRNDLDPEKEKELRKKTDELLKKLGYE